MPRITGASVSSSGRVNNVEMENVGLILAVTARINDDGLVTMEVDLEKSQLGDADEGTPEENTELVIVENWFEDLKRLVPHPEAN